MSNGGILGASGRPMVAFGDKHAWRTIRKGDVMVSLQWVKVHEWDDPEPCMCLFRANVGRLVAQMNSGAYVIPQNRACQYVNSVTGAPSPALLMGAVNAAKHMGFYPDQQTCFRIADAIAECIPDLLHMPDIPPADEAKALFEPPKTGVEVHIHSQGETIAEGQA